MQSGPFVVNVGPNKTEDGKCNRVFSDFCRKYDGMALDFKIILVILKLPRKVAGVPGSNPGGSGSEIGRIFSKRKLSPSAPLLSLSTLVKLQPSPLSSDRWCNSLDNLLELLSADPVVFARSANGKKMVMLKKT